MDNRKRGTGHWLIPLALLVLAVDVWALTIPPPHLRTDPIPVRVQAFAGQLPSVQHRSGNQELVNQVLQSLSLEQKIGQLLLVGGFEAPHTEIPEAISRWSLGNVLLDSTNLQGLTDLAELSAQLQQEALGANGGIPLLIGAQQEGGAYDGLRLPGLSRLPSPADLGEYATPDEIERAFGYIAAELDALGINLVLTPNLDLATEPRNPLTSEERLFGASVNVVAHAGLSAIAGLQNGGIAATARHFPGIGPAQVDPWHQLPSIRDSLQDLEGSDLEPFRLAIGQEVAVVQIGQVCYPLLQGERTEPAWQSRAMVQQLLRDRLQFMGVVLTGDLAAPSLGTSAADRLDRAIKALKAGCDLLLYTGGASGAEQLADGLINAVAMGTLPQEVVDSAASRVLRLKTAFELFTRGEEEPAFLALGELPDRTIHRQGLAQLYENMETRANPHQPRQVERGLAPPRPWNLTPLTRVLVAHVDRGDFTARYRGLTLGELVQEQFPGAIDLPLTLQPDRKTKELEQLALEAQLADIIIVGTWKQSGPGQRQMFQTIANSGKPVIVISRFERKQDNAEMPDGTIQYYWVANNTRSVIGALAQCFEELLLLPPAAEPPVPQGGSTARPMPAIPEPTAPDPLIDADAAGDEDDHTGHLH